MAYCQDHGVSFSMHKRAAPGDSYVVLSTTKLGGDKFSYEVFFWQGKESTQVILPPIHGPLDQMTSVNLIVSAGLQRRATLACSLLFTASTTGLVQDQRIMPEHMLALQDETGASAILAEQLDASMGGRPQEHRELQGQESPAFQAVRLTAWPSSEAFGHLLIMRIWTLPCHAKSPLVAHRAPFIDDTDPHQCHATPSKSAAQRK